MRVEPQDELRAAMLGSMGRDARDGSKGQRVIAAQKDRQPVMHRRFGLTHQSFCPAKGLRQIHQMRMIRDIGRVRLGNAQIDDRVTQVGKRCSQTGGAIGVWPHQAAFAGLAAIHGCAEQCNIS